MNNSTSGNYPPGAANDPFAPYNQPEYPEYQEHDVAASFTLDKSLTVTGTSNHEGSVKQDLMQGSMTP